MAPWTAMRTRAVLAAFLAASCLACFEQPVKETMEILFHEEGGVEVSILTRIAEGGADGEKNPAARERLDAVREAAIRREDVWARGIQSLEPPIEQLAFEFHDGLLVSASRRAFLDNAESLPRLFEHLPVSAFLTKGEGVVTLELLPSGGNRASDRQERHVHESLDAFGASVAGYVKATAGLYRHLEASPERARACFRKVFQDVLRGSGGRGDDLTDEETDLVKAVTDAMGELSRILVLMEGEEYTLDELSQLVYNPFPASVEIEVAGVIEEAAGFEPRGPRRVAVPGIGLWSALEDLRDAWVSPNPVLAYIDYERREGDEPFDLDAFLSEHRVIALVPDAASARAAIEARLRPEESYRLRWRPSVVREEEGSGPPEEPDPS